VCPQLKTTVKNEKPNQKIGDFETTWRVWPVGANPRDLKSGLKGGKKKKKPPARKTPQKYKKRGVHNKKLASKNKSGGVPTGRETVNPQGGSPLLVGAPQ